MDEPVPAEFLESLFGMQSLDPSAVFNEITLPEDELPSHVERHNQISEAASAPNSATPPPKKKSSTFNQQHAPPAERC